MLHNLDDILQAVHELGIEERLRRISSKEVSVILNNAITAIGREFSDRETRILSDVGAMLPSNALEFVTMVAERGAERGYKTAAHALNDMIMKFEFETT